MYYTTYNNKTKIEKSKKIAVLKMFYFFLFLSFKPGIMMPIIKTLDSFHWGRGNLHNPWDSPDYIQVIFSCSVNMPIICHRLTAKLFKTTPPFPGILIRIISRWTSLGT